MENILQISARFGYCFSAALSFVQSSPVAAGNKPTLSNKEVKVLIASVKTKVDHQKLADYYIAERERFQEEARDHDEIAEMYKKIQIRRP